MTLTARQFASEAWQKEKARLEAAEVQARAEKEAAEQKVRGKAEAILIDSGLKEMFPGVMWLFESHQPVVVKDALDYSYLILIEPHEADAGPYFRFYVVDQKLEEGYPYWAKFREFSDPIGLGRILETK